MNPAEAQALIAPLAGAFPWMTWDDETVDLWATSIQDLELEAASEAVRRVVLNSDRPTIKLIREHARAVAAARPTPRLLPENPDPRDVEAGREILSGYLRRRRVRWARAKREERKLQSPPAPLEDCPDCGEQMTEGLLPHAALCLPRIRAEDAALEGREDVAGEIVGERGQEGAGTFAEAAHGATRAAPGGTASPAATTEETP